MVVEPLIGVLRLDMACSASNSYLTLLPYYHQESKFEGKQMFGELLMIDNDMSMKLGEPIDRALP